MKQKELEAHLNYKVLVKVHPFIYEEAKKDCDLKNYLILTMLIPTNY